MRSMKVRRRFETRGHRAEPYVLPPNDPALLEMRTIYSSTVRSASATTFVLKSGENSTKLGNQIIKGVWKRMAIYSLTLEERKTCPATCQQLSICFGNNMPFAQRWNVDTELYARLRIELEQLSYRHRVYAVRLHVLGDFPSIEYVEFWLAALEAHPGLRLFGFTHWDRGSEVGSLIEAESVQWDRFRIRFSDHHRGLRTAHVIPDRGEQGKHPLGIICPADHTRPKVTCGSCALCINSTVPIVLKAH
jgi:hypothetical protein